MSSRVSFVAPSSPLKNSKLLSSIKEYQPNSDIARCSTMEGASKANLPNVIGTTGLGCLSLILYGSDQQLLVVGWIERIRGVKLGDVQDQIASLNTVIEP